MYCESILMKSFMELKLWKFSESKTSHIYGTTEHLC